MFCTLDFQTMSILKYFKTAGGRVSADSHSVRGTESEEQMNDIGTAGEAASPERGTAGEFDSRERGSWSATA